MTPERPLEKYDYFSLPTALDLRTELTDILGYGRADAKWDEIKEVCSINSDDFLSLDELRNISQHCHELTGPLRCFGFSLKLKIDTFVALERNEKYNPDRQNIRRLLHDEKRLETIANLGLSDDKEDPFLLEIVKEASEKLDLPISVVSILFNGIQYFTAHKGLGESWLAEASATDVEWSFCQYVLDSDELFEVEDAEKVSYLKDSPLVTNDSVICYLGAPLTLKNGVTVGSLCVIGQRPKSFSDTDKTHLLELADRVANHLNERLDEIAENSK